MSHSLQGAGGIGGLLARTDMGQWIVGGAYASACYFYDGNGNVAGLVYTNGIIAARYTYDPFGNILTMSGPLATINKYRFSSKEWNDNAGIYYYGYRFYDPSLQRWLNRDPIQEWGGYNLYTFISNMAVNAVDAFGLCNQIPNLMPQAPYDPYAPNNLTPADLWPPNMEPIFPPNPSTNPLGDFGSQAAKGLWGLYGKQVEQQASNIADNLGLDPGEQLGLTAAGAAGVGAGLFFTGNKVQSPDIPITKNISVNAWIQQNNNIGKPNNNDPLPIQCGISGTYKF